MPNPDPLSLLMVCACELNLNVIRLVNSVVLQTYTRGAADPTNVPEMDVMFSPLGRLIVIVFE